ncbi:hypothetical protein Pmar_PMAR011576 [Perkinsus marinus ATCC 50983]|uniref:LsmAD domain-containing protein n=1 Tax=Perkinsus marinus (strain ATCC 50983 / TXsc) TaxID=423536 RepID=C5LC65_PERM5|nr:hypothetical protein Pmar_PMAR011576 [Perkinsus marinus ATCC 50983]EER05548.1 hypothetical protein Pmar_PMAR011576 [Perkinsus marinus ATCC 50983]|eukprot:XP_002773732.1 hypothetical protein Pmar_PMAR011576 [Perkinsus marinus ATCC 50983]
MLGPSGTSIEATSGLPLPSNGSTPLDMLFASVLENDPLARLQGEWHGREDHKVYKVQGRSVHVSKDGVPLRTYDKLLQHKEGTIYWGSTGRYILDSSEFAEGRVSWRAKQGSSSFCWERQSDSRTGEAAVRPDLETVSPKFVKMNDLAEIEGRKRWYLLPSARTNYVHVHIKPMRKEVTTWWKLPSSVTNYVHLADRRSKGSVFRTDHEILAHLCNRPADDDDAASTHALRRVDEAWLDADTAATADLSATDSLEWDQFRVNEERFGVHTSFNWKLYTTDVPKNLSSAQRSKAETIAREIEKEESLRGKNVLRGTDDEEALYGAVIGTGRYAQPEGGIIAKGDNKTTTAAVVTSRQRRKSSPQRSTDVTGTQSVESGLAVDEGVIETVLASLQGLYVDKKGKQYFIEGKDSFAIDAETGAKGVSKPLVVTTKTGDSDTVSDSEMGYLWIVFV